jgi:hypothetical protein
VRLPCSGAHGPSAGAHSSPYEIAATAALAIAGGAAAQTTSAPASRAGSPDDNLPANIRQLTWCGERAAWSPNGKRIAFQGKLDPPVPLISAHVRQLALFACGSVMKLMLAGASVTRPPVTAFGFIAGSASRAVSDSALPLSRAVLLAMSGLVRA